MFDLFLEGEGGFPVDLGFLSEHDCGDNAIGAVRGLNAVGSKFGLPFELLAAFAVVQFPATGELGNELLVVWDNDLPAFDEFTDG